MIKLATNIPRVYTAIFERGKILSKIAVTIKTVKAKGVRNFQLKFSI